MAAGGRQGRRVEHSRERAGRISESLLTLVAQQIASAINSAVAYQIQQRRAEELAELDRAKTIFANISHEFRTR